MTANAANAHVTFLFKMSNSVVSGDDSVKEGTQLTLTEESCINKESENNRDFDSIIFFLLKLLLFAGSRAKLTAGGNPAMD